MDDLLRILDFVQKRAEQAEVFRVSSQTVSVDFEANRLKQTQSRESTSVALRIFKKGKVGFAFGSGVNDVATLVAMAVETAPFGPSANFEFPSLNDYADVAVFDSEVPKIAMEQMAELGSQLIAKVKEHTPELLCDVEVTKGVSSVHLVNSRGGEARWDRSFFAINLEGMLTKGTDMLFVEDSEGSCRFITGVNILANRLIRQLELAKRKTAISTKQLPIIFTPQGVASALLPPLLFAFSGKAALEGTSWLKDKLGERVFDTKLTIWDDATLPYRLGSCPCDGEGVPSQRIPLVTKGEVTSFLYDLQTAALAGKKSTGSGRRLGDRPPVPNISSVVIDEGKERFEDMVKDMREGLIVERLIGAEQGNLLNGDFSGNVLLGYRVADGNIVGRVKDTMVSGNVYQVLKEIIGVGNEARWVDGVFLVPHLYCPILSVATKT